MRAFVVVWWNHLKHVLLQVFIAVDQLGNVLLSLFLPPAWPGAWADESLSSRAYRADRDRKIAGRIARPIIDLLFIWQRQPPGIRGHCHGAFVKESARYNSPPEQRQVQPASPPADPQ